MTEVSEKQLEANRQNSKLGGVKTPEGKEKTRLNALKHGILSQETILATEDERELSDFREALMDEFKAVGGLEEAMADLVVVHFWRLKRVYRIEKRMIENDLKQDMVNALLTQKNALGAAFSGDLANNDTYGKLVRYEANIERGLFRALHELQRLQAMRMGQKVPLPIAVDVNVAKEKE